MGKSCTLKLSHYRIHRIVVRDLLYDATFPKIIVAQPSFWPSDYHHRPMNTFSSTTSNNIAQINANLINRLNFQLCLIGQKRIK